jgi:hypothetical protein
MGGQDAHPTRNSFFVEQASCLFLKMVFMGGQDAHPTRNSFFVEQASCGARCEIFATFPLTRRGLKPASHSSSPRFVD